MFMGFMAENSVQLRDSGFKVGFEDVDKGVVGLRAQRIVVRLGGDAEADLPGCAPVAAAGAFDAQRLGGEDGNRAVDASRDVSAQISQRSSSDRLLHREQ